MDQLQVNLPDAMSLSGSPPTLTLPHTGGGDKKRVHVKTSPPPLWGRVRVGGTL